MVAEQHICAVGFVSLLLLLVSVFWMFLKCSGVAFFVLFAGLVFLLASKVSGCLLFPGLFRFWFRWSAALVAEPCSSG